MSEPAGVWLPAPLLGALVDARAVESPPAADDDRFRQLLGQVLEDQGGQLAALAGLELTHAW